MGYVNDFWRYYIWLILVRSLKTIYSTFLHLFMSDTDEPYLIYLILGL